MVKIGITILLMGLVYSYGVQAEDTNSAVVESIDANENKDAASTGTSDSSDSKSDSEVDVSKSENNGWLPQLPPMPHMPPMPGMPPMFENFHGFRMPPMPRMPSLEDIQKMAPNDEFTKVYGSGASFSSSKKVVNGEVIEDKQYGKVVTNDNGEVQEKEFGNN